MTIRVDEETELRLPREEDAALVYGVIMANMDRFEPFMGWIRNVKTVEDELEFIHGRLAEVGQGRAVQFFAWRGDSFVGSIGTVVMDRNNGVAEIGYLVTREVEGTGLAYKAVGAFVDHLFATEGMHRVYARIMPENRRSRALIERLGFTHEGIERESYKLNDAHHDLMVYSILAQEWRAPREGV